MVPIKSKQDIQCMREGAKILIETFSVVAEHVKIGVSAAFLDQIAYKTITKYDAVPSFLGYQNYQYTTCISKNEEVVHGIPYEDKLLLPGDICSIDVGVYHKGLHVDAARIFVMEDLSDPIQKLVDVTTESFYQGVQHLVPGGYLGDMSHAIQSYVEPHGFSMVRDLYSHGVGHDLHEEPLIPNYGKARSGLRLKEGMVFAIEPMVNIGTHEILTCDDKWTIITADQEWSAHYENTVLITADGPEILTI